MDNDSLKTIEENAEKKRRRKKIRGDTFKIIIAIALLGCFVKKPILHLINGHGIKHGADGMNWLIYESPTGVYVPYSNYWVPYIFGMVSSYVSVSTLAVTSGNTVSCFLRFSEELLQQLYVIKLGLRNTTRRANHLYNIRYGKGAIPKNNAQYDECLIECLKSSVKHHLLVIELFNDLKVLMYIPLFTVIFDGGVLICMAIAIIMINGSLAALLSIFPFLVGELYYTYVYCAYGEQLQGAFAEVGDQLYQDDFLQHSKLMKPFFILLNAYSIVPKKLSAAGFTSPNLPSFGNVLRTAYSLINVILTQK